MRDPDRKKGNVFKEGRKTVETGKAGRERKIKGSIRMQIKGKIKRKGFI